MNNIYTSGDYLRNTKTWHSEDSPWKAKQISKILQTNNIIPDLIAEVGCGVGKILSELSQEIFLSKALFKGYDISPQAIMLAQEEETTRISFHCKDIFSTENFERYDCLLAIDVFEHVPGYIEFLHKCRGKATYKIYHIPLDIHVSSVLRNTFSNHRYTIGHIHYFTADTALAVLVDTGHEVIDYFYTNAALDTFYLHPTTRKFLANIPRRLLQRFSLPFTARLLGGYSLLVLAK